MRLAIVIVVHRRAELLVSCLASLAEQIAPGLDRVIVVDNGSGDDTPARIRAEVMERGWSGWVQILPRADNGGFAVGTNAGLRLALSAADPPRYCMLLNDDTVVQEGALWALLDALESNPAIAIAGSGLEDPDGAAEGRAFRFPGIASELERSLRLGFASRCLARWIVAPAPQAQASRADWVAGAAMIVRSEVLARIGLLDENFFLYFDDIEFCLRAERAGYQTWFLPQSRITHLRGQTTGMRRENWSRQRVPPFWFRSRRYYFEKAHGWWYATLADVAVVIGSLLRRLQLWIRGKADTDPPHYLRDLVHHTFESRKGDRGIESRREPVDGESGDDERPLPVVHFENIEMHAVTLAQSVSRISSQAQARRGGWVVSLNLHHLQLCAGDPQFAALCAGATLAIADGMPLVWGSRLRRTPLPERVAGSDLVTSLAGEAERRHLSLFLLGGAPGASEGAAENLRRSFPALRIAGILCPPPGFERDPAALAQTIEAVAAARPDIVYVGLGKPKQEWLIDALRRRLPETWFLGVGVSLSFLSGDLRRAPAWMRGIGLEWLHRLAQEPNRLGKRYLLEGIPAAIRLWARALRERRA